MQPIEPNGGSLSGEAVRAQVERVLASEIFSGSERLCRFLRFVVEAKLRGEDDQLKEYLVGREVFDRGEAYDPRTDPIVRVEARRLRAKLDEYYSGPGRADPIRIWLPKGGYAPQVEAARELAPAGAVPAPDRRWLLSLGGVAALLAGGTYLLLRGGRAGPRVAVLPGDWFRPGAEADAFEEALTEQVSMNLTAQGLSDVISWPSVQPYRTERKSIRAAGSELGADFVAVVSSRTEGDELKVTVHLVNPRSDRKAWAAQYRRRAQDAEAALPDLARVIAEEVRAYFRAAR